MSSSVSSGTNKAGGGSRPSKQQHARPVGVGTGQSSSLLSSTSSSSTQNQSQRPFSSSSADNNNNKSSSKKQQSTASDEAAALSRTRGVLDYLRLKIPKATLLQLYLDEQRGPFVCRAIVQQLNLPSQQILMRLQCTGGSFPLAAVKLWLVNGDKVLTQNILPELRQWAIIKEEENVDDADAAATASEKKQNNNKASGETSRGKKMSPKQPQQAELTMTDEFRVGFTASICRMHVSPWQPIPKDQLEAWERVSATKQKVSNISSGNNKRKQPSPSVADPMGTVTPEDLERYTQTVWDSVLHFLVGTERMEPPAAVVHFLLQTGLMQPDPDYKGPNAQDEAPLVITEKGYDFMLQDNYEQVWHFCLQYLQVVSENKEKGERMVKECLLLLICLSFCRNIGQAYSASSMNKSGRRMLKHLAHFGLLYVRELTVDDEGNTKVIFYPTRAALSLIGTGTAQEQSMMEDNVNLIPSSAQWSLSSKALEAALAHPTPHDSSHLAVIVQTNFQVCAYTTSELHVSMLGLFCDVGTIRRLPNVVFLHMTRDSVKSAFHLGIQARQILRFLEKHSHPKLRVQSTNATTTLSASPIPSNVVDQIWLWDRERARVREVLVFEHQCVMEGEYEAILEASQLNNNNNRNNSASNGSDRDSAVVWSSQPKKLLYIDYDHVERIQTFIKQWRGARAAAGQVQRMST